MKNINDQNTNEKHKFKKMYRSAMRFKFIRLIVLRFIIHNYRYNIIIIIYYYKHGYKNLQPYIQEVSSIDIHSFPQ